MNNSIAQLVIFLLGLIVLAGIIVVFSDVWTRRLRNSHRNRGSARRRSAAKGAPSMRQTASRASSQTTRASPSSPVSSGRAPAPSRPVWSDPPEPETAATSDPPAASSLRVTGELTVTPSATTISEAPGSVAPTATLADLDRRIDALAAQLERARDALSALPATFDDYYTLNAECLAADQALRNAQTARQTSHTDTCAMHVLEVQRMHARVVRVVETAAIINKEHTRLSELNDQLHADIANLGRMLEALEQNPEIPLVLTHQRSLIRETVMRANMMAQSPAPTNHDALRRMLRAARALADDVASRREALAHLGEQQRTLIRLLRRLEFSGEPEWHRAIRILSRRSIVIDAATAATLAKDADQLVARLQALHQEISALQTAALDEAGLLRLAQEASVIEIAIQDIWKRARIIVQAHRSGN